MEIWGFFHHFWRIFYIKNAYPPPYLPPDPPPLALQKGTPPLAGKILRPPTFFNLSTYGSIMEQLLAHIWLKAQNLT